MKRRKFKSVVILTYSFLIIIGALIANGVVLFSNLKVLRDHQSTVQSTQEVVQSLDLIFSHMKDAETGERGFVITGDINYLQPFNEGRRDVVLELDSLQRKIKLGGIQAERLSALREKINAALARYEEVNEIRRKNGFEAAQARIMTGTGKLMMDQIRDDIRVLRSTELENLAQQSIEARKSSETVDRAIIFDSLAILIILTFAFFFIRRYLVQQESERDRLAREGWLKGGLAELSEFLRGDLTIEVLAKSTLNFFGKYINAQIGTFYVHENSELVFSGAFAGSSAIDAKKSYAFGEGLVGEAAAQNRLVHLKGVPKDYIKITSSLGETPPNDIIAVPLSFRGRIKGVIELGSMSSFTENDLELFKIVQETIGIAVDSAQSRNRMQELLEETQRQAEELHAQQEELRANNEELETQSQSLMSSQERLQLQQEELRQTNEELEQQARILEAQKDDLRTRNTDLTAARLEVERKAKELSQASQYKSEFLANMSHELRTPLNSMLILATLLSENDEGRLTEKQVEFARTIHRAGSDLLNLINDILDLSKVEAGKLDMEVSDVSLLQLTEDLASLFRPLAEDKGLAFKVEISKDIPETIASDRQRIEQIAKNFLSNAIKFTEKGSVTLSVDSIGNDRVALSVSDTGIGIPDDKQSLVFEAFQQADGSTSRKFGGTGLGLTISRELAALLDAEIKVRSKSGSGSTFSLVLPLTITAEKSGNEERQPRLSEPLPDYRYSSESTPTKPKTVLRGDVDNVDAADKLIVIVEDDPEFGQILINQAREAGFKAILAGDGESVFELVKSYNVAGILLDIRLPDISGLAVLERLKSDLKTRHLPVHIVSGTDVSQNAMKMGAIGYLMKPVNLNDLKAAFARIEGTLSKEIKRVLIVEDDEVQREAMKELLAGRDIEIDAIGLGRAAIEKLEVTTYDCMILDLRLPDISGFELLEILGKRDATSRPPVVVYTGRDLSQAELDRLRRYAESIIIKGAKSPERLLDEVSLFLHRVEADLPKSSKSILQQLRGKEEAFENRNILLVDDDMRNVFALANALSVKGLKVTIAKNGKEAVEAVKTDNSIELVLMDIMMPVMDGYEAMEIIRKDRQFKKLPIIALTAKAMKGDQERCLASGANDYLPKPIQLERLLSLLRVWLPPKSEL